MARFLFVLVSLACFFQCQNQEKLIDQVPDLLYANSDIMHSLYRNYKNGNEEVIRVIEKLRQCADSYMQAGPFSVMQKGIVPPSGDKHDYISQGPYWWPDTTKPDGLPYIRQDGIVNPERDKFTDRKNLGDLINITDLLSKAYFFTGEEKYAQRTIELLSVWFLDDGSRMNPHLEFGQGIPGRTDGRGIGIIETRNIGKIGDAISLIRTSEYWNDKLDIGMSSWFKDYLIWLLNSKKGKDEAIHPNNHGTWYDVQTISLAIHTNQDSLARTISERTKTWRLDKHIMQDGSQPEELARTRSFSYSAMNLKGLIYLADIADKIGVDLWNYKNIHGATLQDALDFLVPASMGNAAWEYEQIKPISEGVLDFHLLLASEFYDEKYAELINMSKYQDASIDCSQLENLFYIKKSN